MVLSQSHRSSLFTSLAPVVGEEEAEALLAEFPVGEGQEAISRDFLRAEMAELRGELRGEMAELRGELLGEMHRQIRELMVWLIAAIFTAVGVAVALSAAVR